MAGLSVQYPQGLEDILGWGGITSSQRYNEARQNNQINQQSSLQDMFHKEQQLPVDLDYKRALTGQTTETTRSLKDKNDLNDFTKKDRYLNEILRLAKEWEDNELSSARSAIEQLALSPSYQEREIAKMLMSGFKEVEIERQRQNNMAARQVELEQARGENQRNLVGAKATTLAKPMTMQQYEALLRQKASEGDEIALQSLAQLEEDKRRRAAAGALITDTRVRGLLGLDESQPDNSSTGKVAPKTDGVDYSKWTMQQWKQRYPNATDEQIRASAKAKGYDPK